jgi:hypothetical protein
VVDGGRSRTGSSRTTKTMPGATAESYLQQLTGLCAKATTSLLLAAPFVKSDIVKELIGAAADDVEILVVTRWHVDEIAAQVSDLEVWPIVRDREKSRLLLQQRLHAKYYRADQECLIGSANITAAALAGSEAGNIELLVSMAASNPQLHGFEERMLSGALIVDDTLYRRFCALIAEIQPEPHSAVDLSNVAQTATNWYPKFRVPDEIYRIYQGSDDYSAGVLKAARHDLLALTPPPGLGRSAFEAAIGIALLTTDLVRNLDSFIGDKERRFGEVRDWLSAQIDQEDDEGRTTQTLIRWLLTFLPDRYEYRRPGYSELLSLRRSQQKL